nr:C40 family peptidase [Nocardia sp. CNY236]
MEAPAILPAPMNTPAIELPVPMGVPAIELPAWLDDVPGIELPFLDELPLVDFPFPFGAPENIPWSPTPPGVVMPEKTPGEVAVEAARSKLGATYSYGAVGPDSFDCSGLVQWSYMQADVDLPRTSYAQVAAGTPVPLDQLRPGDVVSFYGGDHSALYAGDGEVIHASTYGVGVTVSPISSMPVSGACRF